MSKKLWGGRFTKNASASATEFNASIDFDQKMYKQDITGTSDLHHPKFRTFFLSL